MNYTRRSFVKTAGLGGVALAAYPHSGILAEMPLSVQVLNPYNRVPISLIIDDSTCLVNMAHLQLQGVMADVIRTT